MALGLALVQMIQRHQLIALATQIGLTLVVTQPLDTNVVTVHDPDLEHLCGLWW